MMKQLRIEHPKLPKGYDSNDIYKTDETGLFYCTLPEKLYTLKVKNVLEEKFQKERLTVLLYSKWIEIEKVDDRKSCKPRCFKGVDNKFVGGVCVPWYFDCRPLCSAILEWPVVIEPSW